MGLRLCPCPNSALLQYKKTAVESGWMVESLEIDEMIYAFDFNNEPQQEDYNFDIKVNIDDENFHTEVTNRAEWDRYQKDTKNWEERTIKGQELFGKRYSSLWI